MTSNDIIQTLKTICPEVSNDIKRFYHLPATKYIQHIFDEKIIGTAKQTLLFRNCFIDVVSQHFAQDKRKLFIKEFLSNPIIQTSPHCQLYLDKMNFYTMILSCIGTILSEKRHLVAIHSSTITLEAGKKIGPAWLNLKDTSINLLNLANSHLSKYSVCAADENIAILKSSFEQALKLADKEESKGLQFFSDTIECNDSSLSQSFLKSNTNLIAKLDTKNQLYPIFLSDSIVSDVIAQLIFISDSLLNRILFDVTRRSELDEAFHYYSAQQKGNFAVNGTYYFWGIRNGKIKKLMPQGEYLIEETGKGSRIKFDAMNISIALQKRIIVPNLFLQFLVMSVIPQVKIIGGTRQIAYLPCFKQALMHVLKKDIEDENELKEEIIKTKTNYWGAKLIENFPPPLEFITKLNHDYSFEHIIAIFEKITLKEISNDLSAFRNHPKWSLIKNSMRSKQ